MAKRFKLPKKINGFRLPKKPRKQANRLLKDAAGPALEGLVVALLGAVVTHLAESGTAEAKPLKKRLADAVTGQLTH